MIYERYIREESFDLPVKMNLIDFENSGLNYWLSCMIIDEDAMCRMVGEKEGFYISESGKSCLDEILGALAVFNAEGRSIGKTIHM